MYRNLIKRLFDFFISLIILLIIWPVLLVVSVLLFFFNERSGVFFFQERPGKDGKIFKIIKFRTMNNKTDAMGKLLPDVKRITSFGNFVRNTSLDELPQLINVLKGDMALIGPRPLLVQYLTLYSKKQARRHEVRPGITGWAQVHGRNNLSWTEKFKYDVWYVDNVSFFLDVKILFMTVLTVFKRENINNVHVDTSITMENFNGSN